MSELDGGTGAPGGGLGPDPPDQARLRQLAEEQAALRRVATLVARGTAPEQVFAAVIEEVGRLLPVDVVSMSHYQKEGVVTFVARWGPLADRLSVVKQRPLGGRNVGTLVFETGRPARVDGYTDSSAGPIGTAVREFGLQSSVGSPIIVDGRLWGVIAAGSTLTPLLMVCSFGDRPEMWAPFDAAVTRLGQRMPDDLRLLASTYADPVRTAAGVLGQLDSAISALPAESDQVRILTVSTAAFFTDRLAGCREPLWRVVRNGREGGAAARTITALTLLGTDGFMSGDWGAAQQAADECLQACQTRGCPVRAWMPRTLHALLAAARGDYDMARELSEQIVQWALRRSASASAYRTGRSVAISTRSSPSSASPLGLHFVTRSPPCRPRTSSPASEHDHQGARSPSRTALRMLKCGDDDVAVETWSRRRGFRTGRSQGRVRR